MRYVGKVDVESKVVKVGLGDVREVESDGRPVREQ